MKSFDLERYVAACDEDPARLATVSLPTTAHLLGVTRPAVRDFVRQGQLEGLRLTDGDWQRTVISVKSLARFTRERRSSLDSQEEQVNAVLEDVGGAGDVIHYGDLMARVGMKWRHPPNRKRIGLILGHVSEQSAAQHDFMLSALAVSKATGLPNDSFFQFARKLGLLDEDADGQAFHQHQLRKIWRHYRNLSNQARERS